MMHPLQAVLDAMSSSARRTRSGYHLTLGGLINFLQAGATPSNALVFYDAARNVGPGEEMSYRGYYSDLAFQDDEPPTAQRFLDRCIGALGGAYDGYKGGAFIMGEDTPLWRSEYGVASGIAIIGAEVRDSNIVLKTKIIADCE